ncbi:MAG: DNA gyrase/topoisomerase IV subunit A, partial [Kaistella sp.]
KEGFIGYGLKKDEFVEDCSDIDDIITFRRDGTFKVTKIKDKEFVGKDIIHAAVWKKNDERMIYNMIYVDAKSGISRSKRFSVTAITRDKEYDLTLGNEGSKVLYFSANPNSEAETVTVYLSPNATAKNKIFDFDFSTLEIKGRSSQGNILTKYAIRKVNFKEKGASTLGGRDIWYDKILGKLNVDKRGKYLGQFDMDDSILAVYKDGSYELTNFDLINKYEAEQVCAIEKWKPERVISAVYYDSASKLHYAKRFVIETTTVGKKFSFIPEVKGSKLLIGTTVTEPKILVKFGKKKTAPETHEYLLNEIANVKGWKAMGTKLTELDIQDVELLPSQEEGVSDLDNYDDEGNIPSSESSNSKEIKTVVPESAMAAKPKDVVEVKQPVSFIDVEAVKVTEKPKIQPKPQILSNEEFVKNKLEEKSKKQETEKPEQLSLF